MQKICFERSVFFNREIHYKHRHFAAANPTKLCLPFLVLVLLVFAQLIPAQSVRNIEVNGQKDIVALPLVTVNVSAPVMYGNVNALVTVPIDVSDTTGLGIYGYRFQISFDPAIIRPSGANFGCSIAGTQSDGTNATCNLFPDSHTITVFWFTTTPISGTLPLINLKFLVVGSIGNVSPLQFVDFYFNEGGPTDPVDLTTNGSLSILFPSAANVSVSGRAVSSLGRPISNAQVFLTDSAGLTRLAMSNPFGFFRFDDVGTGSTYILGATSKRYTISPRLVSVQDNITGADLIADP